MQHSPLRPAFVSLVLATGLLTGCGQATPEMEFPPAVVFYKVPEVKDVTDYSDFTGRTAAVEAVTVRARVWGYLKEIKFKEGALVNEGDVLFEIDPNTYQTMVDQAQARLNLAEAQVKQAMTEADRNLVLRSKNSVSQEDLEKSLTARDTAAAAVDSARADVARAQLDLDYTKVRAAVKGRVGRALVTRGNLVQSGEMGGTALTTLVSVDPVYAYFDVDDLTYQQVKHLLGSRKSASGQDQLPAVELGLAGETGFPHRGEIDFIDNQVDANTGTLRMRGKFSNPDFLLTPGLFARIHVPLGASHTALLVTDRAVDTDQGVKVVYVVNTDDVVEKRTVRLGKLHLGLREIVSGVKPGERVIVDGIQRVHGGDKVVPKEAKENGEIGMGNGE